MAVVWAKYLGGPTLGSGRELSRFDMHGISVVCNIPVIHDSLARKLKKIDFVESGYLIVHASLMKTALSSGEPDTRYACSFSDPRFHAEVYLPGPSTKSDDGQQCREVRITKSAVFKDRGRIQFLEDEVVTVSQRYCLDNRGRWLPLGQQKNILRGPRY